MLRQLSFQSNLKMSNTEPFPLDALKGENVRYIPEWDLHRYGSFDVTKKVVLEWPIAPGDPTALTTVFCSNCGLTWLSGLLGKRAAAEHPRHLATGPSEFLAVQGRSLLLHVSGVVAGKDKGVEKAGSAAIGVYFGTYYRCA